MDIHLELHIDFGAPMPLSEVEGCRHELPQHGVYFPLQDHAGGDEATPFDPAVVYIGKAMGESMFSRCRKHFWDIMDVRLRSRENKAVPADAFRAFGESINFDPSLVWIVAAKMDTDKPYLIAFVHDYLLWRLLARRRIFLRVRAYIFLRAMADNRCRCAKCQGVS
jgi:hypothetical protein